MDLLSPPPFSKLGTPWLTLGAVDVLGFLVVPVAPDNGLGGRLDMRESPLGGCGNELMLTVLRIVFPLEVARPLGVGRAEVGAGTGGGRFVDGARSPLLGVLGDLLAACRLPVLLRVLGTGSAGNAEFGGPTDGRGGLGNVVIV